MRRLDASGFLAPFTTAAANTWGEVENHGSIFLLQPLTPAANSWIEASSRFEPVFQHCAGPWSEMKYAQPFAPPHNAPNTTWPCRIQTT